MVTVVLVLLSLLIGLFLKDLPSPKKLEGQNYPVSTLIFDRYGTLLYEIYADANRTPIKLDSLPPAVVQATLAIEDANFYHHFGFSLQGIIRAVKNTVFANKLQGGSTITQQLVKTALLENPERTLERKLREAVLTLAVEIIYSKDQILEMYLNHVPYGGTAYGIEAAAKRYFGKNAADLNLAESALLAGLPQAPSRYSPFLNPDRAKARQGEVLRRLVEEGYISQTESDHAFQSALTYALPATDIKAPHFVFYIKSLLEEKYGLEMVERGGLRVTTTLDLALQNYAQSSVSAEIAELNRYRVGNGAALITHPNTGEVLAMIGSKDYFATDEDGQVNLTTRLRQPGSSIKPLNYVTALQLKKLNPASVLLDYPTCFLTGPLRPYCPKNYDNTFHGPVSVRSALANSYNIPAVKTLAINSLESMIATASAMGITTFTDPARYGLSLTLGGGEITMVDMATAFGTLANQGVKVPLQAILEITDYQGNLLESYDPQVTQQSLSAFFVEDPAVNTVGFTQGNLSRVLNREPAYLISHILADNQARSAAFGANSALYLPGHTVSVKTGTTNDLKDNWTIGYTPEYLVTVWVGNNDNTPMNPYLVSGVTGAAPIWHSLMSHLVADQADQPLVEPPGIDGTNVCQLTGRFPRDAEPCDLRYEYFWQEAFPQDYHRLKKNIWVYKDTGLPAFIAAPTPAANVNLDNLELKEHLVYSDPLVPEYCLDCPWPVDNQGKAQYPKVSYSTTTQATTQELPGPSPTKGP